MGKTGTAICVLALALLAGCESGSRSPLRIGVLVWPPYELAFLARDLGHFDAGSVELVDYESPATVQRAYRDGAIDALMVTADYALQLAQEEAGQRIILVADFSEGGDVLVARPDLTRLADLRGRRVGVERSALGAYVLHRAMEKAGLALGDVEVVPADIPDQEQAFLAGAVDAVVTYEPIRTRLLAAGAKELFSSREIPGEIVDVLVTNVDVMERHEDHIKLFVQGWLKALHHLESDRLDAAKRMAPREGLQPEEFLEALGGVKIPGREENLRLLSGGDASLEPTLERLAEVMRRSGSLSGAAITGELLEPRFVKAAGE